MKFLDISLFLSILSFFIILIFYILSDKTKNNNNIVNSGKNYGKIYPYLWKCPLKNIKNDIYARSQFGEDKWIINYFKENNIDYLNNIFIEIGAYDGFEFSNTYLWELKYGWRGLLIEGSPVYYNGLIHSQRPYSAKINKVVCNTSGIIDFNDKSLGISGIKKYEIPEREDVRKENHYKVIQVECSPMRDIIKEYGLTHIDVFSLDVEGAELELLNTFDWSVPVRIWIVEINSALGVDQAIEDEEIRKVFRSHGYKLISKPIPPATNEIWLNQNYDDEVKELLKIEKNYYNDNGHSCI